MSEPIRTRLTIPKEDVSTLKWLNVQQNPSVSVRMAIHKIIEMYGYSDITCLDVSQLPKRGRPAKDNDADEETVQAAEPMKEPAPPSVKQASKAERDEDGFVDPENFFN